MLDVTVVSSATGGASTWSVEFAPGATASSSELLLVDAIGSADFTAIDRVTLEFGADGATVCISGIDSAHRASR